MARRRFPLPQVVRILMLLTCAVVIILSRDACGQAVKNLFNVVAPPVPTPAPDGGQR